MKKMMEHRLAMEDWMNQNNIAIALSLDDQLLKPLHEWGKNFTWTNVKEVHFFHIIKKNVTPLEFGLVEMPDEKTLKSMIPTIEQFLKDEAAKIIPASSRPEIKFHVWGDFNPKQKAVDFLQSQAIKLLVCSTRGLHGPKAIFQSSFADYMIKFAPCDIYIVRPKVN